MSKKRSFFQRWQKQCETRDDHFDPELKSHYYKTSFDKVFQGVEDTIRKNTNMTITSTAKDRGEIAIKMSNGPKAFIVATVIQVRPFETAVDFMVSSDNLSITGLYPSLKKVVLQLYAELDKSLPFVGTKK
ncbi:hypothetical protein OEV98_11430 [Caldibacillus lycopersici]|uniref:Cytosolic protein n=1 Tax=Perspicuibacillus lycopersici TaxID=1325689 RepID=A0AAE3LNS9_9BACI|nr:hypothetical protein [Perspicuibacillus lycopersici]MCU9614172.1 hypothetical protein [Perspicuibacillus lycopersici]